MAFDFDRPALVDQGFVGFGTVAPQGGPDEVRDLVRAVKDWDPVELNAGEILDIQSFGHPGSYCYYICVMDIEWYESTSHSGIGLYGQGLESAIINGEKINATRAISERGGTPSGPGPNKGSATAGKKYGAFHYYYKYHYRKGEVLFTWTDQDGDISRGMYYHVGEGGAVERTDLKEEGLEWGK